MSTVVQPQDVVPDGVKWLQVWDLDALGECTCLAGSRRWKDGTEAETSLGGGGRCARPGKHPWWIERDGDPVGFKHGSLAAVGLEEARGFGTAGNRLAAVPGDRVCVLDLDGDTAFRTFLRISRLIRVEDYIGAARTPRGFHVWLRMVSGGWSQASALAWMRDWLGAGMGGLDLRCGDRSYVVWPGGMDGRRWMPVGEWKQVVERSYVAGWDIGGDGAGPVWLAEGDAVGFVQRKHAASGEIELPPGLAEAGGYGQEWAWAQLELALEKLAGMAAGAGRNNRLNVIAYHQGSACVWLGIPRERVVARLEEVGKGVGTHGVAATVRSGLGSGMDRLKLQGGVA